MKRNIFIALIFLLIAFKVNAQRQSVDKGLKMLRTVVADTDKIKISIDLVDSYTDISLDSVLYYGKQGLLLAQKSNDPYWKGLGYYGWGLALFKNANYPDAMDAEFRSLVFCEAAGDSVGIADAYLTIGYIYRNGDDYRNAVNYFKKARDIYALQFNQYQVAVCYAEAGKAYEQMNVLDSALSYGQEAYKELLSRVIG